MRQYVIADRLGAVHRLASQVVATPTGSVVDDLGSLTVQNLSAAMTAEHAARLAARRANGAQGQPRESQLVHVVLFPCAALLLCF